jgi:hypothetical protein
MGFPSGVQTVVLTGQIGTADGAADRDPVTITQSPERVVSATYDYVSEREAITVVPDRSTGVWTVRLLACDAVSFTPTGWTYEVQIGDSAPFFIQLPAASPTVDIAAVVPVSADPGQYDVLAPVAEIEAYADAGDAATLAAAKSYTDGHAGGGTPSSTVVSETGYGQAAAAGSATAYARGDHTHGTPAAPPSPSGTVASGTSFGQSSTAGAATAYSRGDHAHGTPTLPTATTSVAGVVQLDGMVGDIQPLGTAAVGSTGKAADGGHAHLMPRLDQVSAPTAAVGLNSQKITSLANGTVSSDAAAFGQIPVAGATAGTYAAGNDSRLSDARTPTAHKTSHATGGSDALAPSDIGALDAASMLLLSSGQGLETIPRWAAGSQSINMTSGAVRFGYFTARRSGTCTGIRVPSGGTAAGATPTVVRFGLYAVDSSGNLTLLSATVSDTTVFAGTFTSYTRSLAASQSITLGSLYAIGIIVVTGAQIPSIAGGNYAGGAENLLYPPIASVLTGQSNLPSSVAVGSLTSTVTAPFAIATGL